MNAPWNVGAAEDVLRVVQRSGLGRECVALCADCLVRVVGNCLDSACSLRCEVSGDSLAHAHDCFVWRLPRARFLAMVSNLASSHRCGVPGDSCGHTHDSFVRRLPRARCRQCLQTLRPVTGAKSQVLHLGLPMTVRQCLQASFSRSK